MSKFALNDFVRKAKPSLLNEYFRHHSRPVSLPEDAQPKEIEGQFVEQFNALDPMGKKLTEADFQKIDDLSSGQGFLHLKKAAELRGIDLSDAQEAIESSARDAALYFYLRHQDTFDSASVTHEIRETGGWRDMPLSPCDLTPAELAEKVRSLESTLVEFYRTELRGHHCVVERYEDEGDICFVAYVEDYTEPDILFEDGTESLNRRLARKPVFKQFFLYDPANHRLSTKTEGGFEKARLLQALFTRTVLDQELDLEREWLYNLNVFKDPRFEFGFNPMELEWVHLKSVRLSYPATDGRRLTLDLRDGESGLGTFRSTIAQYGIRMEEINITQVSIQAKFRTATTVKGQKGTVTFQVSYPNSCSLGNRSDNKILKRYLVMWGIDG